MIAFFNRIYRTVFCRGGYGVHSPFVFDLLTTVIEEHQLYYCYEQLHTVRLQILQRSDKVMYGNREYRVEKLLEKYGFTEPEHRLLFRLANRFQPETVFSTGSDFGLTPLYLTAYAADSACIVIEPEPSIASFTRAYLDKYSTASVELRDDVGKIPDKIDFFVWSHFPDNYPFSLQTFDRFLPQIHEGSVMIISGINASMQNRKTWKTICAHPKVTVTIDMLRLGIVFFNPKLYRKTFKSIAL